MDSKLINAGGLWINQSKSGASFLSGKLGNIKVLIFKNDKKTKENQPDYYMCLGENEKKQQHQENDGEFDRF